MYHKTLQSLVVYNIRVVALLSDGKFREIHTCFINILNIECAADEVIVFESARYGRNDSSVAQRCTTPFSARCEIDVTLRLNRKCAGKQTCALQVNTATFDDPCGYEEFLIVKYDCVQRKKLSRTFCPLVVLS